MTTVDEDEELPYAPVDDSVSVKLKRRRLRRKRAAAQLAPKSTARTVAEWVAVVAGALIVALVIRTFLFGAYVIPSGSMKPTLAYEKDATQDRVLVNKLSYKFHDIHRGDVIVFDRPEQETDPTIDVLIKRVIALPGETISLDPVTNQVTIDGRLLDEPYLNSACAGSEYTLPLNTQTIPEGMVFVMGDNRCNSSDSRAFGPIPEDSVIGRAFVKVWPLNHLGWL